MFLAKVTGSVVSTQKVASLTGNKLLTVEPLRVDPAQRDRLIGTGRTFVVVDTGFLTVWKNAMRAPPKVASP